MMTGHHKEIRSGFRLGEFTVFPPSNEIRSNGTTERIKPKEMEVLLHLARHRGKVVYRQDLLDTIWADTYPNDEGLTQAVSGLRKALGDDPKEADYIETIPKKGYRLSREIEPIAQAEDAINKPSQETEHPNQWTAYLRGNAWNIAILGLITLLLAILLYQNFIREPEILIRKKRIPVERMSE